MDIAAASIKNRTVTLVLTIVMLGGGLLAFGNLSRLEDPEFTIKECLVITPYPGASAQEVEEEVSDELEMAVQQLGQLDEVESRSVRGMSTLNVRIKDKYDKTRLPQVWDEVRRKVGDAQSHLPPGAGPSLVLDDFGDVYGIFIAITGPEYSYAELQDHVELLRRELLLVEDVAKITTFGERPECIYVEPSRDRMAELGIPMSRIVDELRQKNAVVQAGRVRVGPEYITIAPAGSPDSVEALASAARLAFCATPFPDDPDACVDDTIRDFRLGVVACRSTAANTFLSAEPVDVALLDPETLEQLEAKPLMPLDDIPDESVEDKLEKIAEEKHEEAKKAEARPAPSGQVVEINRPRLELAPDKARYVSEYDSKVDKETVARGTTAEMVDRPGPEVVGEPVVVVPTELAVLVRSAMGADTAQFGEVLLAGVGQHCDPDRAV